jgi:hypothetical protein
VRTTARTGPSARQRGDPVAASNTSSDRLSVGSLATNDAVRPRSTTT